MTTQTASRTTRAPSLLASTVRTLSRLMPSSRPDRAAVAREIAAYPASRGIAAVVLTRDRDIS